MADNIKYIQWAAKVLKVVMVINVILGLITFVVGFYPALALALHKDIPAREVGFYIDFGILISVVINAFITYTAARGLELVADMAYRQLVAWHQSQGQAL